MINWKEEAAALTHKGQGNASKGMTSNACNNEEGLERQKHW